MTVLGIGPGKCGSHRLAKLLGVSHEAGPFIDWDAPDVRRAAGWLRAQKGEVAGDVAPIWLRVLPDLLDEVEGLRVVGLGRDVGDTVASYLRAWPDARPLTGRASLRQRSFPTYRSMEPEAAWRRYVEEYYAAMEALAEAHEWVAVLPVEAVDEDPETVLEAAGLAS